MFCSLTLSNFIQFQILSEFVKIFNNFNNFFQSFHSKTSKLFSNLHPNATHHIASTASDSNATSRWSTAPTTIIIAWTNIFVGLKEHQVDFWREQTRQHHSRADVQTHAQTRRLYLVVIRRAKVDGDRREEHNAGAVHSEANVLGLVEVFGNFSRLECVQRAQRHQEDDKDERNHEAVAGTFACQHCLQRVWIDFANIGRIVNQPCD